MNQTTILATTESKQSGSHSDQRARDNLASQLAQKGVETSAASFERVYARVKHAETQSGSISERQLEAIVADALAGEEGLEGVAESFR